VNGRYGLRSVLAAVALVLAALAWPTYPAEGIPVGCSCLAHRGLLEPK
jgi:hypothetical protein